MIGEVTQLQKKEKYPVYYGESFKGSKCYEVQTKETSPWLEGSWERSSELAAVLPVPRKEGPAGSSSTSRGPGLGSTEVTGRGLCLVSFDWHIGCVEDGSGRESRSQILNSSGHQGASLGFIHWAVRFC